MGKGREEDRLAGFPGEEATTNPLPPLPHNPDLNASAWRRPSSSSPPLHSNGEFPTSAGSAGLRVARSSALLSRSFFAAIASKSRPAAGGGRKALHRVARSPPAGRSLRRFLCKAQARWHGFPHFPALAPQPGDRPLLAQAADSQACPGKAGRGRLAPPPVCLLIPFPPFTPRDGLVA